MYCTAKDTAETPAMLRVSNVQSNQSQLRIVSFMSRAFTVHAQFMVDLPLIFHPHYVVSVTLLLAGLASFHH